MERAIYIAFVALGWLRDALPLIAWEGIAFAGWGMILTAIFVWREEL